jgi:hypothetical protein
MGDNSPQEFARIESASEKPPDRHADSWKNQNHVFFMQTIKIILL